jgi:hypothetical protein
MISTKEKGLLVKFGIYIYWSFGISGIQIQKLSFMILTKGDNYVWNYI